MALTIFGKEIRKARLDVEETLSSMSLSIGVTPAFLSALETGRKKIPDETVTLIDNFFTARGKQIADLRKLADVSNKNVSLEGLNPRQQMLVAGFARSSYDAETLEKLAQLLDVTSKEK